MNDSKDNDREAIKGIERKIFNFICLILFTPLLLHHFEMQCPILVQKRRKLYFKDCLAFLLFSLTEEMPIFLVNKFLKNFIYPLRLADLILKW